jgi:hypothetical protein
MLEISIINNEFWKFAGNCFCFAQQCANCWYPVHQNLRECDYSIAYTVKPVQGGTWIRRKLAECEQIL